MTDVGDRYVLERLMQTGAVLGGEQSGHVVDLAHHTTGDGMATALMLLAAIDRLGLEHGRRPRPGGAVPAAARGGPRRSRPASVRDRVWQEVDAVSEKLGERGRVVLRASGTEPVVRVMVEAEDEGTCQRALRATGGPGEDRDRSGCVGCAGSSDTSESGLAKSCLLAGLERLEYRGYDSAGICLLNGEVAIIRRVGRVDALREAVGRQPTPGDAGAGPHPLGDPRRRHRVEMRTRWRPARARA